MILVRKAQFAKWIFLWVNSFAPPHINFQFANTEKHYEVWDKKQKKLGSEKKQKRAKAKLK